MNKVELIAALAAEQETTKTAAKKTMDALESVVREALVKEGEVKLFDGVTLYTAVRPARMGHNPATGASIEIPEMTVPKCKFGKAIKDLVK